MTLLPRLSRTALCLLAVLAATLISPGRADAQVTAYTLQIDQAASYLQVRGTVYGFALGGDRRSALGGEFSIRTGNPAEPLLGLIVDDALLAQLDPMQPTIENPIPFFPPLGELDIRDILIQISSGILPLAADGSFAGRSGAYTVLDGTISGEVLGSPIGPVDLDGNGTENAPIFGSLNVVGSEIILEVPISLRIQQSGADITVTGLIRAVAPVQ